MVSFLNKKKWLSRFIRLPKSERQSILRQMRQGIKVNIGRGRRTSAMGYLRASGFYNRYGMAAARQGWLPENKFLDTYINAETVPTVENPDPVAGFNGYMINPMIITQGAGQSQRDGRLITIKSIQLRATLFYHAQQPAQSGTVGAQVWLWCILDTQANGARPQIADIFSAGLANDPRTYLINLNNSGRFKILKKWLIKLWPSSPNTIINTTVAVTETGHYSGAIIRQIEWFKRCNIRVDYSAATGDITEVRSNAIHFMAGSVTYDSDNGDASLTLTGQTRVRFMG